MNARWRVLLIAAKLGYQTRAFDDAAQRMGVELIYATDRCDVIDDPWGDRAFALKFDEPHHSIELLLAQAPSVDAAIAVGDQPAYLAALFAARRGLHFSSPDAVAAAMNKHEARKRFAREGLLVPQFSRISVHADAAAEAKNASYPCVLKPLSLSASRGVIRADNSAEFEAAFVLIRDLLQLSELRRHPLSNQIQIEEFIPGREFALEGILTRGELQVHAIFDKPDELNGPYFEETIYVTPSREAAQTQAAIIDTTRRAIAALGLTHGPVHAEMRVNQKGVYMLEIAARPIGGICARALRFKGGVSLEELILLHALGSQVSHLTREEQSSGVMMLPVPESGVLQHVTGVDEAMSVPHIWSVEITAKEGYRLLTLPEGASYPGFLFARATAPAEVENALRCAHAKLHFDIATELKLVGR